MELLPCPFCGNNNIDVNGVDKNLCNALAKMLIHLIENKIIEV